MNLKLYHIRIQDAGTFEWTNWMTKKKKSVRGNNKAKCFVTGADGLFHSTATGAQGLCAACSTAHSGNQWKGVGPLPSVIGWDWSLSGSTPCPAQSSNSECEWKWMLSHSPTGGWWYSIHARERPKLWQVYTDKLLWVRDTLIMIWYDSHQFSIHAKEILNTEQHTPAAIGPPDCWSVVTQPTCITTDLEIYYFLALMVLHVQSRPHI